MAKATNNNEATKAKTARDLVEAIRAEINPDTLNGYAADFATDWIASDNAYICDAFTEFADGRTSIYYSDIMEFIRQNPEALAEVIDTGLYDPSQGYDLYKHGQAAEFMTIENELNENAEEIAKNLAVEYADNVTRDDHAQAFYSLTEEEQAERLEDLADAIDGIDTGDRLDDIKDAVQEFLNGLTDDEFTTGAEV